ncbi:glycosyltransferase family 2 protein [Blastococcus sp. SYSU DS0619]
MTHVELPAGTGAVCVLHGNPPLLPWLHALADTLPLVLVVNDPAPGRYPDLPTAATVLRNAEPEGFAVNVHAGTRALLAAHPVRTVLVLNFDLQLELPALADLVAVLDAHPRLAAAGPLLVDAGGRPVFSVGRLPRPAQEFLRAAGLRQGRWLQLQRALMRRAGAWTGRNTVPDHARLRVLAQGEYLPWTCVAVRRDAWESVGGLDTRFRMYAEDIDWSIRATAAGWQLAVVRTDRPVEHSERWTRSPVTDAWFERSQLQLHAKYGWRRTLRAQRLGLALRRCTPLRWTARLAWSELRR